jgi:hypothetical protein
MWFRRRKRTEVWEEPLPFPLGDIEAAQKIRDICRAALDSAEHTGNGALSVRRAKRERDRYERAARAAMEIAMKMSDELMRDASVGEIVRFCMKAADLKTAKVLARAIQAASIKGDVLSEHPALAE